MIDLSREPRQPISSTTPKVDLTGAPEVSVVENIKSVALTSKQVRVESLHFNTQPNRVSYMRTRFIRKVPSFRVFFILQNSRNSTSKVNNKKTRDVLHWLLSSY